MATDPRHGYCVTVEEGRCSDGTSYYTAIAPELPNCLFQADAPEKAREGLHDVVSHLIDLTIERGKTPPTPWLARRAAVGVRQTSQPWPRIENRIAAQRPVVSFADSNPPPTSADLDRGRDVEWLPVGSSATRPRRGRTGFAVSIRPG